MGLGANLGDLGHVVEVAGETTRLLPVSGRTTYLFGKAQADAPAAGRRTKAAQLDLFGDLAKVSAEEAAWSDQPAGRHAVVVPSTARDSAKPARKARACDMGTMEW